MPHALQFPLKVREFVRKGSFDLLIDPSSDTDSNIEMPEVDVIDTRVVRQTNKRRCEDRGLAKLPDKCPSCGSLRMTKKNRRVGNVEIVVVHIIEHYR